MNKKAIFVFILIIILIIIYIGFTINRNNKQNEIIRNDMIFDEKEEAQNNETIETSVQTEKTTPNTILILKKHYTDCNHDITGVSSIPGEMVNLDEEQIKERYANWNLEKFSKEEIILSRTLDSFCGEHYYVTEENDCISIYAEDEQGNRTLKEAGKISTKYLPEVDRINLRNGIKIYGTENLNKLLQDFE